MFFTSYSFIIFLSIIFLLYYLIPKRLQWPLLLIASYIFYGFAGIKYFTYIVLTTISTYIVGLKIGNLYKEESKYLKENKGILSRVELKEYRTTSKSIRWKWLLFCMLLNFGILGVTKYTNFTISNINFILAKLGSGRQLGFLDIALPMGFPFIPSNQWDILLMYIGKYEPERNILSLPSLCLSSTNNPRSYKPI